MKLATIAYGGVQRVGWVDPQRGLVRDLAPRLPADTDLITLIDRWGELGPGLDDDPEALPAHPLDEVELCAPIPVPRRNILCVGKNYAEHAAEMRRSGFDRAAREAAAEEPPRPIVFTKAPGAVVGPGAVVDLHPDLTSQVDYEAELAVIIGPGGRGIPAERAMRHVWGYTIVNDVTARDLQTAHQQWFLGKSLDTHCPMGPWAVTADEISPAQIVLECRVNGELRQKASAADLIFDIPALIQTISAGMTLQAGDIIATGTPAGVGMGMRPPAFLRDGDVVEISLTGLGTLRNEFLGARPRGRATRSRD